MYLQDNANSTSDIKSFLFDNIILCSMPVSKELEENKTYPSNFLFAFYVETRNTVFELFT